ncbi:hypothetical protein [Aeromonas sp. FDAARGOS 1415]|uniref:hypothetical protein n=1 Tax=Aeromonas TaxID=642 RepID=UPI001C2429F0|nr:hypothetical protein [Aeromonas sp. FDAARGOS 1415]QXB53735.1 hypothetical protein I6L45_14220 [Aeromonas sp. FDAARGOS 1415]
MITKLGGGAEHCEGGDRGAGMVLDQSRQLALFRQPLQGAGEQGQRLGERSV